MIISDLCDEYAVLVSQNKAPVYGYDNQKRFNKTNKSNEDNEQGENND